MIEKIRLFFNIKIHNNIMVKCDSDCEMEFGDPIIVFNKKTMRKEAIGTIEKILYSRVFDIEDKRKNGVFLDGIEIKYENGELHLFSFEGHLFKLNKDISWGKTP
jgi:hypothetical protein